MDSNTTRNATHYVVTWTDAEGHAQVSAPLDSMGARALVNILGIVEARNVTITTPKGVRS